MASNPKMLIIFTILFSILTSFVTAATQLDPEQTTHSEVMSQKHVVKANPDVIHKARRAWEFLYAHNKVRIHAGLMPLEWDRRLARYARRYAQQRANDCQMVHSNGPYGENLFWGAKTHWTPTDVVKAWVSEHKDYDKSTNKCEPGKACGHYTQVVWKDTARVGCAHVECKNGGFFAICSYDPPGNYVGEGPFGKLEAAATKASLIVSAALGN